MSFKDFLLKEITNLPGEKAHKEFYPLRFINTEKPTNTKPSAVGIHFFELELSWHFILIERSEYIGHHSKQIAFPGGKKDPEDSSLLQTAIRESEEEISIAMENAEFIGAISPVYIPVSNFEVLPHVFVHNEVPTLIKSEKEVNEILFVKCSDLLDDRLTTMRDIRISETSNLKQVPCFVLNEKVVWGATALMLSELKVILSRFYNLI